MNDHLVVYAYMPHYRYSVFKELEATPDANFAFVAGTRSKDGTIPVLNNSHLQDVTHLRNIWLGPFLWQRGLLRIALQKKWTAVIFDGNYGHISTWIATALLRLRGVPVAFWTIGWHKPDRGIRKWYRLAFYSLANRLMLYGHDGRDIGLSFGYPPEKMGVIHNSSGTPEDSQQLIPAKSPQTSPWIIGCVIRLNPVKRLDLLIAAASILRERGRDVTVAIVGDGPERQTLEGLAAKLDVPLQMPGAVYDEDSLKRFYERCAVTIVPSAAGLSITQSLRYGRPAITHDNPHTQMPEYEAIIEGQTGGLFHEGNPESLANVIDEWLRLQLNGWHQTASACHAEIKRRWTGEAHARSVRRELTLLSHASR